MKGEEFAFKVFVTFWALILALLLINAFVFGRISVQKNWHLPHIVFGEVS